jgi:FtsZ-binding cell division protein ZapB
MLSEYEQRVEKTMEELALLQLELEENKESNQ